MSIPKISILIANYNNGIFFEDCYKSLILQTVAEWEAIVIDDCSTDNSAQIITEMIGDDRRFRFYQNDVNIGYQKSLIKAVAMSDAEIFGRLDPDDALRPDALSIMIDAHKDNPEAGLIYSNFTICDDQLKPIKTHYAAQVQGLDEKYLNFDSEISHFATFKKSVYLQTGGFDPFNKRAEDKDIYMKMCEAAPVKYLDEALYLYRMHSGGSSSHSNEEKALFWHVVALIKMSERRNINIEDVFVDKFVPRTFAELELERERAKIKRVKNSRIIILLSKLGLINFYNDL